MRHYTRAEMELVYNHIVGERLPGRGDQLIGITSQTQRFRTGARRQLGNKVYHYAHANGILSDVTGAFIMNPQDAGMRVLGAAYAAGVTQVLLTVNNTEGPAQNGSVPVNYLEGGTVVFMTALGIYVRGIIANAVKAAGTGTFLVTLDAPTSFALVVTDSAEIIASPYARVCNEADTILASELCSVAGIPTRVTVDGDWLWLQTWGPCYVTSALTLGVGNENRLAYFVGNGVLQDWTAVGATADHQIAGFVMANAVGGGQGAPFVWLTLDP